MVKIFILNFCFLYRFYQIYSGTNQYFKINKLEEITGYRLKICASNEAGVGPFSEPIEFFTSKAPPAPLKGLFLGMKD